MQIEYQQPQQRVVGKLIRARQIVHFHPVFENDGHVVHTFIEIEQRPQDWTVVDAKRIGEIQVAIVAGANVKTLQDRDARGRYRNKFGEFSGWRQYSNGIFNNIGSGEIIETWEFDVEIEVTVCKIANNGKLVLDVNNISLKECIANLLLPLKAVPITDEPKISTRTIGKLLPNNCNKSVFTSIYAWYKSRGSGLIARLNTSIT